MITIWLALTLLVPPLAWVTLTPARRQNAFTLVPLSLVIYFGAFALGAAASHSWFPHGWMKLFCLVVLGLLTTQFVLDGGSRNTSPRAPRALLVPLLLSILGSVEVAGISFRQGTDPISGTTYLRPPFHEDTQRHLLLTNALVRGEGSPMLARTPLVYQIFWHHPAATFVAIHEQLASPPTNFPLICAFSVITAFLFFFGLFWALSHVHPNLFGTWKAGLFWGCLLLFHSDFYHLVVSIWKGSPGIESDWSVDPGFLRYFSVKAIALTAPQHAIFFAFALPYLALESKTENGEHRSPVPPLLLFLSILSSPILSGLLLAPYVAIEAGRRLWQRKPLISYLASIALVSGAAGLAFRLLYGFPIQSLASRPGTVPTALFDKALMHLPQLPLIWLAAGGGVGIVVMWLIVGRWREKGSRSVFQWGWPGLIWVGLPLFCYFVLTNNELRRHSAIVMSVTSAFFVAQLLSSLPKRPRRWVPIVGTIFSLSLLAHVYFLYCYVGKPSFTSPTVPFAAYFEMNAFLRAKKPRLNILAATEPFGTGISYPPVMEATTSYSLRPHAAAHTQLTPLQDELTRRAILPERLLAYARELGYDAMLWGPLEERIWGKSVKDRYVVPDAKLAEVAGIGLYAIRDRFQEELAIKHPRRDADFFVALARRTENEGFVEETEGRLQDAIALDPKHGDALEHLSRLKFEKEEIRSATWLMGRAVAAAPRNLPRRLGYAQLLRDIGEWENSRYQFAELARIDPKSNEAREGLVELEKMKP